MKRFLTRNFLPALLAVVVFMTVLPFFESLSRLVARYESAVEWHGYYLVEKKLSPGDVLRIIYRAKINKQCPSYIRSFLIAEDGSVPVRFPVLSGGYARAGDEIIDTPVSVVIPKMSDAGLADFKSGKYILRTAITRFCPEGIEEDNSIPDVEFELVVDQKAKHKTER